MKFAVLKSAGEKPYLMGMFSTLPHLIDAPMEEILAELPVAGEVKEALLTGTGPGGALYRLTQAYDGADRGRVSFLADRLGIVLPQQQSFRVRGPQTGDVPTSPKGHFFDVYA